MIGNIFGKWTVLERSKRRRSWSCLCECGNTKDVWDTNLRTGSSVSCGCDKELRSDSHKSHGMSNTKIYEVWHGMVARCHSPSAGNYKYYGAVGIGVCSEWRTFENFYKDMGDVPYGLTLDRINPTLHY